MGKDASKERNYRPPDNDVKRTSGRMWHAQDAHAGGKFATIPKAHRARLRADIDHQSKGKYQPCSDGVIKLWHDSHRLHISSL